MMVPKVNRTEYTLVDVNEDMFATLMTEDGDTREDLKLEGDTGSDIKAKFEGLPSDASLMVCAKFQVI
ncbi:hypothetical protein EB796_023810 [Bugula neritina]|uniref:Translation initiation factor 5A C-terminal domain-containing protein n=1 Tax=Bugula neritina TaxID=10212 RepID=A0A7J7IWR9_BUGNE|nr:hypothetical protein EB796_023810 [Bugula neritina]